MLMGWFAAANETSFAQSCLLINLLFSQAQVNTNRILHRQHIGFANHAELAF